LQLNAKKLACFTSASIELASDGINFETVVRDAFVQAVAWYMDLAFLTGSGVGQPLGVLNDPSIITVAAEGSQTADSINYTNLTKMFARLHPAFISNAVWLASPTIIPQLMALSITIGDAGSHVPVLNEQNGKFTILGKEVIFTEKLPVLGDKGDIILADLSQYIVGMRKEVSLDKSLDVGWLKYQANYRCVVRVDGQGSFNSVVTPKNGDTLSWAVTLAARA